MSDTALLAVRNVAFVAGGARVLDGVNFGLGPGERVAIVGDSGAGKSLLLRLATGLIAPTSGLVQLFGDDLADLDADATRLHRSRCGLVLQGGSLLGSLSVEDNLWLGLGAAPAARQRLRRRLDRLMLEFHLEHSADRIANGLSAGEQRRVELARAFLRNPELMILDEPFEGASAAAAALERQLHRQIVSRGRALLLLTQDAALADRLCQRVYRLERGRLVERVAA